MPERDTSDDRRALDAMRQRLVGPAGASVAVSVAFAVAGFQVLLRSRDPDGLSRLAGSYHRYPSASASPDLILDVETIPGLGAHRERGPAYPGFERRYLGGGRLLLTRFDARGELHLPDPGEPVRARFQVGESPNTLEAAVRVAMSVTLPRRGAVLVHASAVIAPGGQAAVFAGVSGAGKSTIAAMLADSLPGWVKLSDELLIAAPDVRPGPADAEDPAPSPWYAHAAPFIGGRDLPHGQRAPVGGVYLLEQAPDHQRLPLARPEALRELLRHVLVYVGEPDTAAAVLGATARWVASTPCYRLRFAKDPGVASILEA